jgi:hypothetical protein
MIGIVTLQVVVVAIEVHVASSIAHRQVRTCFTGTSSAQSSRLVLHYGNNWSLRGTARFVFSSPLAVALTLARHGRERLWMVSRDTLSLYDFQHHQVIQKVVIHFPWRTCENSSTKR